MTKTEKQLTINDLKINKIVKVSQIRNILDTCMILTDTKLLPNNDIQGKLVYYGPGNTEEYTKWFTQKKAITPIYFDSKELENNVVYDE